MLASAGWSGRRVEAIGGNRRVRRGGAVHSVRADRPGQDPLASAAFFAVFAAALYIPGGYYMESYMYRRRQKRKQQAGK